MCGFFPNRSYFPYNEQNCTCSSKSNEKDKEFECYFLTICRYLNLLKKNQKTNL